MSRTIANDHLWTDSEVAYQHQRNRGAEVIANRKKFGPGGELEGQDLSAPEPDHVNLPLDKDIFELVKGMSVDKLQEALKAKRLPIKGTDSELRGQLAQVLQEERDATNS